MRRREFITLLVGAAAGGWAPIARAQQPEQIRRIGVLMNLEESDPAGQAEVAAFRGGLTKLGWTEGSNLRIELRWGAGDADRIDAFATELVGLQLDAILAHTTQATSALARKTRTIPIVFVAVSDPIGSGFAKNFAHPGGNVTGFTNNDPAMGGKWMELLREIAPRTAHVAVLFNPANPVSLQFYMSSAEAAASSFAIQVRAAPVHAKDEIEGVIAAQARIPGGALIVTADLFNTINRELIIALASRYGVPAIYFRRVFAESGGLISYGDDFPEEFRQAAGYINGILKGEKPADLPVQAPTKFELAINLKTAKSLGLAVPPSLLARADEVIE
jgi:putative ABC transport system substrate-binding protein